MIYYVYRTRKVICENLIFNWHDFFWKKEIKKKYKERQNERRNVMLVWTDGRNVKIGIEI